MSEWWTYRPGDFLMFAPRAYWRLFELHNEAWWPAPWLLLLIGLIGLIRLIRPVGLARPTWPDWRVAFAVLAVAWAFVGWSFLHQRFAPIHWAMTWGAWTFMLQALCLAALALRADLQARAAPAARRGALVLGLWALLLHPLLVLPFGRPWAQAEVAGLAPDPTVIATLGLLLGATGDGVATRALLGLAWFVAVAWCFVSAATLWTMGSAQGWVPFGAAVLAVGLGLATRAARGGATARWR